MAKNPPDRVARATAVIGTALSTALALVGLWQNHNYSRWQQATYQESLRERIQVRVSMSLREGEHLTLGSKGKLGIEVTNVGSHPIYLKSVTGSLSSPFDSKQISPTLTFYERDPIAGKEPPRRLEPDEAANFVLDVDFSEFPFRSEMWTRVETTTRRFVQQVELSWVTILPGNVAGRLPPNKTN